MSPKPKAPRWLTEAFRDGVDERILASLRDEGQPAAAYPGADPLCWLAQHDPARRPCVQSNGPGFERFHFIPRQRVENALGALLPADGAWFALEATPDWHPDLVAAIRPEVPIWQFMGRADLILLAAWDPRNGELACEHHHRRFDGHATSSTAPKIIVPAMAVPQRVHWFAADYGLESDFAGRFPPEP